MNLKVFLPEDQNANYTILEKFPECQLSDSLLQFAVFSMSLLGTPTLPAADVAAALVK